MALNQVTDKILTEWIVDTGKSRKELKELTKALKNQANAEQDAAKITKQLNRLKDKQANGFSKLTKSIAVNAAKFSLLAVGIKAFTQGISDAFKENAKFVQAQAVFTGNIESARKATYGLASDMDLMLASNRLNTLGVKLSNKEHKTLLEGVTKLSAAMGIDMAHGLESATTALARQSVMVADNLGITLKVGEANAKYAESIGKTADALSGNEKRLAFQNAFMEQLKDKMEDLPPIINTVGTSLQGMDILWKNFTEGSFAWLNKSKPIIFVLKEMQNIFNSVEISVKEINKNLGSLAAPLGGKELVRMGRIGAATREQFAAPGIAEAEKAVQLRPVLTDKERREKLRGRPTEKEIGREAKNIKKLADELVKLEQKTAGFALPEEIQVILGTQEGGDFATGETARNLSDFIDGIDKVNEKNKEAIAISERRRAGIVGVANAIDDMRIAQRKQHEQELTQAKGGTVAGQLEAKAFASFDAAKIGTINTATSAVSSLGGAMADAALAAAESGDSFGTAMQKIVKATLKGIAVTSAVKALEALALAAFSAATLNPAAAALALKSAGLYTATALAAGAASAIIPGGGGGGGGRAAAASRGNTFSDKRDRPNFTKKRKEVQPLNIEVFIGDPGSPTATLMMQKQVTAKIAAQQQSVTSDL
jgi:hypothetical protein